MNFNSSISVVAICSGLILASLSVPSKADEKLKGNWLRANLPGRYTLVIYGFDIGVDATRNGNVTLTFLGDKLKGSWSIKGDQLCITFAKRRKSEAACSTIRYDGRKYFSAAGIKFFAKN